MDGSTEDRLGITARLEDDTRRTHELRNDHSLGAVHNERSTVGHDREVAHEDGLLLDFTSLGVHEACPDEDRSVVRHVLLAALFNRELGRRTKVLVVRVELEFEGKLARVVFNWTDVFEGLLQAVVQEPLEGITLDRNEVRER